jgi:hypothetical protein
MMWIFCNFGLQHHNFRRHGDNYLHCQTLQYCTFFSDRASCCRFYGSNAKKHCRPPFSVHKSGKTTPHFLRCFLGRGIHAISARRVAPLQAGGGASDPRRVGPRPRPVGQSCLLPPSRLLRLSSRLARVARSGDVCSARIPSKEPRPPNLTRQNFGTSCLENRVHGTPKKLCRGRTNLEKVMCFNSRAGP